MRAFLSKNAGYVALAVYAAIWLAGAWFWA
jgi:hypothetical protein